MTEILELLAKNKEITSALRRLEPQWPGLSLHEVKDSEGFSLLHWAALRGYAELVLYLLDECSQDPNTRGPNEQTPLMWAAMNQELLTMHILLDHGAQLRAIDNINENALLLSCQHDNFFGALWLLGRGADVNCANIAGSTGSHWAAYSGSYLLICLLDAFGFDHRNCPDKNGLLPLHRALELEFWGTARMMVTFDPYLLRCKTASGQDLLEFAEERSLAQQTLASWFDLCRDSSYKTPSESAPATTTVDLGETNMRGVQKKMWQRLVAVLDWLDRSPTRRQFIPMLAYLFGVVFTCAHVFSLGETNRALAGWLGFTVIERAVMKWLFVSLPYLGLVAIAAFSVLLFLEPGFQQRNFVSKVSEGKDSPKPKSRDELNEVDLDRPVEAQRRIDILRRRRRHMFMEMLKYLNLPESLLLFTENVVDPEKDTRVKVYLAAKGLNVAEAHKMLRSNNGPIREICSKLDLTRICPTCWLRRGLRTKHCSTCDRCCEILDHHCAWINCCVGKNSHACFALFILTGYLSQCHQIFLIFCNILSTFLKAGGRSLTSIHTYTPLLLPLLAACLHFITISWSSQLFRAQWKNMTEGYTVSEALNEYRYSHFIVSTDCDETGIPTVPSSITCVRPIYDLAEGSMPLNKRKGTQPKLKKNGKELVEAVSSSDNARERDYNREGGAASSTKESILSGVVEEAPIVKDGETGVIVEQQSEVLVSRKFVRNPFAANQSIRENCLQFWTNSRPSDIDFERLDDTEFVKSMAESIRVRRRKRLF